MGSFSEVGDDLMLKPTKGIAPQRALLSVAAQVSMILTEPMTINQIWNGLKEWRSKNANEAAISFSWFVLALDVLYALGVLELEDGLIRKAAGG